MTLGPEDVPGHDQVDYGRCIIASGGMRVTTPLEIHFLLRQHAAVSHIAICIRIWRPISGQALPSIEQISFIPENLSSREGPKIAILCLLLLSLEDLEP